MQKENLFFFSFSSESTLSKGTKKERICKEFALFSFGVAGVTGVQKLQTNAILLPRSSFLDLFHNNLLPIPNNNSLIVFPDALTAEVIHRSIFAIAAIAVANSYAFNTIDVELHDFLKIIIPRAKCPVFFNCSDWHIKNGLGIDFCEKPSIVKGSFDVGYNGC